MITTGRVVDFKDKVEKMIKSKDTRLCDFGGECFGFACDEYYRCKRSICTRVCNKGR